MERNLLKIEPNETENALAILNQFKDDPKAQRCLAIYRKLPKNKQDILLVAMDAFVMGAEAEARATGRE